jgi:hypothetical protein
VFLLTETLDEAGPPPVTWQARRRVGTRTQGG